MFRRQKRFASGSQQTPRQALALMRVGLLGGWLIIAALTCVVALSLETGQASAASTAAQSCVGSTNGTPVATPPVEEPSATVGSTDTNQTPCATITPTVNGGASSLPGGPGGIGNGSGQNGNLPFGGINGTQNSSGPNGPDAPTGPSNTANPTNTNSPSSQGANACSGPLCWVQNALSSVGSAISHAWNSASTLEKVLIVVGAVVVVVVAVVVVIAALPEEAVAGIVGAGAAVVGFVGDVAAAIWGAAVAVAGFVGDVGVFIVKLFMKQSVRFIPSGIMTAVKVIDDLITGHPGDIPKDAIWTFVATFATVRFIDIAASAVTALGVIPSMEDILASVFGDTEFFGTTAAKWFVRFLGVKGLRGPAITKGSNWLATLLVNEAVNLGMYGVEHWADATWKNHSPLPHASVTDTIISGLIFVFLSLFVESVPVTQATQANGAVSDSVKAGGLDLVLHWLWQHRPGAPAQQPAPASSAQRAHSTSSASSSQSGGE